MFSDLPMPTDRSLRGKLGILPRGGFKLRVSDNESDVDWKPGRKVIKKFSTEARSMFNKYHLLFKKVVLFCC